MLSPNIVTFPAQEMYINSWLVKKVCIWNVKKKKVVLRWSLQSSKREKRKAGRKGGRADKRKRRKGKEKKKRIQ